MRHLARSEPLANFICAAAAGALLVLAPSAAGQASLQGLGSPPNMGSGFPGSRAAGVSADGQHIAGTHTAVVFPDSFRWTAATGRVAFGVYPGVSSGMHWSEAMGISGDGSTVVGYAYTPDNFQAYRWNPAEGYRALDPLGGSRPGVAYAVSADGGVVVGGFGSDQSTNPRAFRWSAGGGTVALDSPPGLGLPSRALGVSADGSVVVGWRTTARGREAFRWTAAGGFTDLGDLPGGAFESTATAVSGDGQTVVGYSISERGTEAFMWTGAGMVALGDLTSGVYQSRAAAVSHGGAVVLGSGTAGAFVWDAVSGMRTLADVLAAAGVNTGTWSLWSATGVSAEGGTVVGTGTNAVNAGEAFRAVIPRVCYANCDGSAAAPVLNVNDFMCFLSRFNAGEPYANCDGSTLPPTLNVNDFICFQQKYSAGCP